MSGDIMMNEETSLSDKFNHVEAVINELENGSTAKETVEKCVKALKSMKILVESMDLMGSNESVEDIPSASLQYLLIEPYLAFAIENLSVPIDRRASVLEESQKLYKEYLLNSDIFGFNIISPDALRKESDGPPSLVKESQLRQQKVELSNMHDKLKEEVMRLELEWKRSGEESVQREMSIKKLQLWCIKAMTGLDKIELELKMLEHRRVLEASGANQRQDEYKPAPLKTFVIPKAEAKKQVFGRGYPSAPTQTVNEWYDQMVESGHFPGPSTQPQVKKIENVEDDQESVEEDMDDEEARKKRMEKDEYLDSHRKGWGNTYGKG